MDAVGVIDTCVGVLTGPKPLQAATSMPRAELINPIRAFLIYILIVLILYVYFAHLVQLQYKRKLGNVFASLGRITLPLWEGFAWNVIPRQDGYQIIFDNATEGVLLSERMEA
jgi:hypothetical protein